MTDKEGQDDELIALASIYEEGTFFASLDDGDPGGSFNACVNLPKSFKVLISQQTIGTENGFTVNEIEVSHLPPIVMNFQLPPDYPSKCPPGFTLSSQWLTVEQLSKLCARLDDIWNENEGDVILFLWTSFLADESLEYLGIDSPIEIKCITPKRKSSSCDNSNNISCDNDYDKRAIQNIGSNDLLLRFLLDYDAELKQKTFDSTLFTCDVCFQDKLGALCIEFILCKHVYCKDCMAGYFESQIKDGSVKALTCPSNKCETQALPDQVKQLVDSALFAKYEKLLFQLSLDTMADIVYCPRKYCQQPVVIEKDDRMGICGVCHFTFCTFCKYVYHGVSPCRLKSDNLAVIREQYLNGTPDEQAFLEKRYGKRAIKDAIENEMSESWLNENSKQCPHCGTHIQKIDGCNKMTCSKCRTNFCYICNNEISRTNPYEHFNNPSSPCYNLLFRGVNTWEEDVDEEDIHFL